MIESKQIKFSCTDSELGNMIDEGITKMPTLNSTVTFEFDAIEMSTFEMFMQWVRFMNAIGYVLDPEEMEGMWNGIE